MVERENRIGEAARDRFGSDEDARLEPGNMPFGSKLVSRDYVDEGVPVIRGTNLPGDRRFSHDDFVFVTEEKADELRANNAHPGDVVFTQRGTLGQVGIIPLNSPYSRYVISQSQMKMTVDQSKANADWLFYCFRNPTTQQEMINRASSSGVPHINLGVLREFRVRLPPLSVQRRIASILSAYDDLIENNTRRIAILEEMARRIYEEWFVRFRFPGHEGVRMVESELGLVPEGWMVVAASEAIAVNPTTKVPREGAKPFIAMNCLADGSMLIDAPALREGNSGSKFRNGDTLFARITPCLENGKTGFVKFLPDDDAVAFGSTEFIVLRSRSLTPEFVYLLARSAPFRDNAIKSMSGASGRQRVRDACFDTFHLAQPDGATLAAFTSIVRPMFALVQALARKNTNLRTTRDLLLPKLISGELDVSALPDPEAVAA